MSSADLMPGSPCPNCGGALEPARPLSPEEYDEVFDRENPRAVSPRVDTAPPDVVRELGALYLCTRCRYRTRVPPDAAAASSRDRPAGPSGGGSRSSGEARAVADARRELEAARRRIAELERQVQTPEGHASG